MADQPIILWNNLLAQVTAYAFTAGVEGEGSLLSDAWTWDTLRPAYPVTDLNGDLVIVFDLPTTVAEAEAVILGAHRRDAVGSRFVGGNVQIEAWTGAWTSVLNTAISAAVNEASFHSLAAHTLADNGGKYQYRMTLSSLGLMSTAEIPEMFLGPVLTMDYILHGSDPANDVTKASAFEAESGRRFETIHYTRFEDKFNWDEILPSAYPPIDTFRKQHLNAKKPFWWLWMPDSAPLECYLVRDMSKAPRMPTSTGMRRSLRLNMVEAV